jgi:hypothetical protein
VNYDGGYQEEPEYGYGMDSSNVENTSTLVRIKITKTPHIKGSHGGGNQK